MIIRGGTEKREADTREYHAIIAIGRGTQGRKATILK